MNIGILTPYYPDQKTVDSGLANHFFTLANGLIEQGNKVVVIHIRPAYGDEEAGWVEQTDRQLVLITLKIKLSGILARTFIGNWSATQFLIQLKCMVAVFRYLDGVIQKNKLDVIETTNYFALCYFYLFKKQTIPLIIRVSTTFLQILNDHYPFKSRLLRLTGLMELQMIKRSEFLITHAQSHAAEMEKLYGLKASDFSIIAHGITLPKEKSLSKSDCVVNKILYVGRFEHRKGVDLLLDAIPQVLKAFPETTFELIGTDTGNTYQTRFRQGNTERVNRQVAFQGSLSSRETNAAYADCTIFVAPSRYESFGLIYIEAMSYGKPVIGCRVGGVTAIIEHGSNGLFAATNDVGDLVCQINLLLGDAQLRAQLGMQGRQTVEEKFSETKLVENSLNYYRKAIQKNKYIIHQ